MADYRSKSYTDGKMQIQPYYGPSGLGDFRSYSTSGASSSSAYYSSAFPPPKLKKFRSTRESSSGSWGYKDPEFQRKKRIASYKLYAVERKMKVSFRKSFRWCKDRCTQVVYGWW